MRTRSGEHGITLLEVVITLALTAVLVPVIGGVLWEFQRIPARTVPRLPISQEMRIATTWIRLDANKAQSFEAGTGDVYGTFRWLDFSTFPATRHKVVYFWEEGSELNPAATDSPLNYGVLYRQPYTEGVSEPKIPLNRHLATSTDLTFAVTEEEHEANSLSTKRVLKVEMTATIEGGAFGTLQESTTSTVMLRPEQTDALEHVYYFLHNDPTPPSGNTNSQTDLTLDLTESTGATLYNYDTDRDSELGLKLSHSSNPAESDNTKFQEWTSAPLSSSLTIDGRMSLFIAAASFEFETSKDQFVLATVKDQDPSPGGSETRIGDRGSVGFSAENPWSLITVHFDDVVYTIPSGHELVVMVQFADDSDAEGMIAYDTTSYLAFLMLPTQP